MKTFVTFILAGCLFSISQATILTVCPNSSFPAKYTSIQTAIDSSAVGDTIYIYPGSYSENPVINKRLVLIGPGINPRRPTKLTATVYDFTVTGTSSSGSVIMGLNMYHTVQFGIGAEIVNYLLISECKFSGGVNFNGYGNLLENCILSSTYPTGGSIVFTFGSAVGNIIQNCIIHGYIAMRGGTNTVFRNNIFASGDAGTSAFSDIQYGETWGTSVLVENNIFFKSNPTGPRGSTSACEFKNNIYFLTDNPVPSNSLSSGNINADPQFVSFPAGGAGFDFSYDYHLQSSSPGVNYGTDGSDVGMWGGSAPVNAGFEPPIPRVYSLKTKNSIAPAGGKIQLTIKATKAQ